MTPDIGKPDETGLEPTARMPKSMWNRDVELDLRKLFEGLTSGVINWTTGSVAMLPLDLVKVAGSGKLSKVREAELAWTLVYSALAHSMVKNTEAILAELLLSKDEVPKAFANAIKLPALEGAIQFSPSFMENPARAPFFAVIRTAYQDWLVGAGLPPADAALVAGRLGTAFTFALHREWLENTGKYAPLLDWLDSPFAKAVDKERRWLAYYAWLETQLDESIFGQPYGLRDLYIPLNAYYEMVDDLPQEGDVPVHHGSRKPVVRKVVSLEKHFLEWLDDPNPKYPVRLISGGPGSGKSSFLKHFAAILGKAEKHVVFIPLQHFAYDRDVAMALEKYIHSHDILKNAVDVHSAEKTILLFDGLDELSMAGTHGKEAAKSFIRALKEYINRTNQGHCRVRAIVSGRVLAVSSDRDLQRDEGRILHLLPYFTPIAERKPQDTGECWRFDDPENILEHDYRPEWWTKLNGLLGDSEKPAPEALLREPFDVLTNQPLLNVLIAISVTGKESSTLKIDENTNLNEVYAHLLHRVWARNDEKAVNRDSPRISEEDFNRALESVAVATWHGNGRTANSEAITAQCGTKLLESFSEQAEKSVYSLLVGFFFSDRGSDNSGSNVYEFTHKSFGEYLIARSILGMLDGLIADCALWKENSHRGRDLISCLAGWTEHCSHTEIDWDLLPFIQRELRLSSEAWAKIGTEARELLVAMINHVLKDGVPMERTSFRSHSFHTQTSLARNAECALLLVLAAIPWREEEQAKRIKLEWPEFISSAEWLNRIRKLSDFHPRGSVSLASISGVVFSGQYLFGTDFRGANLRDANFEDSILENTTFQNAVLLNAVLLNAVFLGADLERVDFRRADLTGADLRGAVLVRAFLGEADLRDADFQYSELQYADLTQIRNWQLISCIDTCDITGVRNAPDGFVEWALGRGAFQIEESYSPNMSFARRREAIQVCADGHPPSV